MKKIHDSSSSYPLDTIEIIHLVGKIIINKQIPSESISNDLLNKIVGDCLNKLPSSNK